MAVTAKIISSLEKCFIGTDVDKLSEYKSTTALRGERVSFQIALRETDLSAGHRRLLKIAVSGDLGCDISVRRVGHVPVRFPTYPSVAALGDDYICTEPGLYPDPLFPMKSGELVSAAYGQTDSFWFTFDVPADAEAGDHTVKVILQNYDSGETVVEKSLTVHVVGAALPKSDMIVTQWFHCDSLAHYYDTEAFSEKHWKIIENFIRTAADNGINAILTPVFTPPLDTKVGGERMTMQLVDVCKNGEEYSFGFDKLERWINVCLGCGVEYFEISHFFTQWGAAHAPKVVAYVDGKSEPEKIFGWETDACGAEYTAFLRSFLKAFIPFMKERGLDGKCLYHISDEPSMAHLEAYKNAKATIADLLEDYKIIDALSNYEFYQTGAIANPVPANNHIQPFIDNNVPDLWTYYCCSQNYKVSNRFIAMPSSRNRVIGIQMYKFAIVGFLQWGYNFYETWLSMRSIDPYQVNDGDFWVPAGDAFSVYPALDGTAVESLRLDVFRDALQDISAMKLCEKLIGREKTVKLIEEESDRPITFSEYPAGADFVLRVREKINRAIEENI